MNDKPATFCILRYIFLLIASLPAFNWDATQSPAALAAIRPFIKND